MDQLQSDQQFMRAAMELAHNGMGAVEPNPMVGCLIVRDGTIIGSGYHQRFGGPHAEVEALASCADPAGATAYVTLEPCCHHGKTPPCCEALIQAGIRRVVIAMQDPFGDVDGGGIATLRRAGVEIELGVLRGDAEFLNAPYLKRVRCGVPWVIAKWAMTADGRIATAAGRSQWITGPRSRAEVHKLRGRVDAIIVGMGTALADDPLLTARPAAQRTASRVVFCRQRLPRVDSRLIASVTSAAVLLVTSPRVDAAPLESLRRRGAEVIACPSDDPVEMVQHAVAEFGKRGMTNVMVEGGGQLLASFFEAGQIDEAHVYIGAKAFGGQDAAGPIAGVGVSEVEDALALDLVSVDQFDDDIRAIYRKIMPPSENSPRTSLQS